jgi:hypothetical protein
LFTGELETASTAERKSVTLSVQPFNTLGGVNAPAGATHFRLVNAITVLSDFAFNATTKVYEPIEPQLNETSKIAYSEYIELGSKIEAPLTVVSTLPGNPVMTNDVSLISCVGIEFSQKVGDNYYLFNVGNSLKIKNIF